MKGIVIDPGDEVDELLDLVERHTLSIKYILLTHAHLDHITGVGRAKAALALPSGSIGTTTSCTSGSFSRVWRSGFRSEKQPDVDFVLRWGRTRYASGITR